MNINLLPEKVGMSKKYFWGIIVFALFNILFTVFIFGNHLYPFISDSYENKETARYLMGDTMAEIFPHRMLKPLVPLLTGLVSPVFGDQNAFVAVNVIFYLLIGFFVFKITYELFADEFQSFIASVFFLSAYPILKYGLSYLTDLAGWFFFCWAVYLVLKFLRAPNYKMAAWVGFISAIGFLAKESGGMGMLFFFLCVVFGLSLGDAKWLEKIKFLTVCGLAFLVPFLIWQGFVYLKFHYSYYDWYVFNRAGAGGYKTQMWLVTLKSLVASFLAGWIFAVIGLVKVFKSTEIFAQTKKIITALIPASLTFLLWFAASSRLFYILGLLLSIAASYFFVSLKLRNCLVNAILFVLIVLPNYLWFIYDDNFRAFINGVLKISY